MSILTAVKDIDRLRQITQVLVRHGFGEVVQRLGLSQGGEPAAAEQVPRGQLGERIRLVLQDLGPTFVKLGQMLSTRPDVIPPDIISELKKLQDDVAPVSAEEAKAQVERSLGLPVDKLFVSFEDEPLASASVAQVHRARLKVDEPDEVVDVAVKIQRPGIDLMVERDLHLLHTLAALVERAIPESRVYAPTGLVREFGHAITAEMDFTIEALNAKRFADNFADEPALRFPRIFGEASSKRVLTLEFLDGLKISEAVRRGADGQWIAETAVRIILKMVFEDGFFHADPHPGNILILPRPPGPEVDYPPDQPIVIALLDLGLVGRLSPRLRDQAVDLLMAAARNDPEAMADAMLAIGKSNKKVDQEAFRAYVGRVSERHLGKPLRDLEASAVVRDILVGAIKFDIEIPVELTMMVRAMMTIEGVGKEIYPELDVFAVARPYLAKIIWQRYHPMKLGSELFRNAGRLSNLARDLPFQLQELMEDLRQGRIQFRSVDRLASRSTERLGRRLRASLTSAALLAGGLACLLMQRHTTLGWGLLVGAGVWMAGHLLSDWSHQRGDQKPQ